MGKIGFLLSFIFCGLIPIVVWPQIEPLRAVRVEKGPVLDGRINDGVWQTAVPFSDFKMFEPEPNSTPSEKTEIRIVYDDDNLYIGVFCYDRQPDKIIANAMAHDVSSDEEEVSDDLVRVLLDPFQDKRNGYLFLVNPRGARSEGMALGEKYDLSWDGIWTAKCGINTNGWCAEMEIPFKTISFNKNLTAWGINVERVISRKMEVIRLSGWNRNSFFYNPREAALVGGIENIRQGLGLTVRPYGLTNAFRDYETCKKYVTDVDAGFDVYKNVSSNLVAAFSYNTDFAETEADDRRLNLTRFPLFFPEKRTFFLEGSQIFQFGASLEETLVPFFSRRVGLFKGEPVPIQYGLKAFGKINGMEMAVLNVRTRQHEELDPTDLFAFRFSQNFLEESKAGIIFTSGDPEGRGKNRLLGADAILATSRFLGENNFNVGLWAVFNWDEGERGDHSAYGFKIDYPNDLWDAAIKFNHFGDSLNPGLGFIERKGVNFLENKVEYMPRPKKGFLTRAVRQFSFEISVKTYWDLAGRVESNEVLISPLGILFENGYNMEIAIAPRREVLPENFEVANGVVLPAGTYDFTETFLSFGSPGQYQLRADLEGSFGGFYNGHYQDLGVGLSYKYKGYLDLGLSGEFVSGDLPQGHFTENVCRLKMDIFGSPDLGLLTYIQYDDVSRGLGLNSRLRWEISPGNILYLVFSKNWRRKMLLYRQFEPIEEKAIVKIQLSFRC